MNKNEIEFMKNIINGNFSQYFNIDFLLSNMLKLSVNEIQYIKGLEIMEKRNKKIDELLND